MAAPSMAHVPQQNPQQQQNPQLNRAGPSSGGQSLTSVINEGEQTFNIYIYDYCLKRGYQKSANEFQQEAGIPKDEKPPIDATNGLLFEWWSVFWLLFRTKGNPAGSPEEAVLYHQYQTMRARDRQTAGMRPLYANGVNPMQRPGNIGGAPGPTMTNGMMPNGMHPGVPIPQGGAGPPQPVNYNQQAHPNGIVHPTGPAHPPNANPMPMNHQQAPPMMGNQPPQFGGHQQHPPQQQQPPQQPGRPPMGPGVPLGSNNGNNQPHPMQPQQPGQQQMQQLPPHRQGGTAGPSHLGSPRTQPPPHTATPSPFQTGRPQTASNPPNAPSPLNPNQPQQPPQQQSGQPQQPQYGGLGTVGRPGSRAAETPRSASVTNPSPMFANRMTPQQQLQHQHQQMMAQQQQQQQQQHALQMQAHQATQAQHLHQHQQQNQPPIMDDSILRHSDMEKFGASFQTMSPRQRNMLMKEAGIPAGKQFDQLEIREKEHLSQVTRKHIALNSGSQSSARGTMQPPANLPTSRGVKRNSSSPEGSDPQSKDQSPHAPKRSRPSPSIKNEMFPPSLNPIPAIHHPPQGPGGSAAGPHQPQGNIPNGGVQRPGSVQMVGPPMNMAHQPIPMAIQPSGPQGNLQPNTMVPQPSNANTAMMMTPQMSTYYRNAQQQKGPGPNPGGQNNEGPNPAQSGPFNPSSIMSNLPNQTQVHPQVRAQMGYSRPGNMVQPPPGSAPPSAQGMNPNQGPGTNPNLKNDQMPQQSQGQPTQQQPPPQTSQQSHQQQESAPPLAPAHPGNPQPNTGPGGMIGAPNTQDGRHSAPATANPSPNVGTNSSNGTGPLNGIGASPANTKTPATSQAPTGGLSDGSSLANSVQRPNTAPVAEQNLPSSSLGTDLFIDFGSFMQDNGFDGLDGFTTDFDAGLGWLNPN